MLDLLVLSWAGILGVGRSGAALGSAVASLAGANAQRKAAEDQDKLRKRHQREAWQMFEENRQTSVPNRRSERTSA